MSTCNPCGTGSPSYSPSFPSFPPPVGSGSSASSGSSTSGGSTTGTDCPLGTTLPVVAAQFTAPAIGAVGQLQSTCASNWAITGNALRLAPFGNILITGVSGNIISYENLTVPVGASIAAGQPLFQFIPASTTQGVVGTALEQIQGIFGGVTTLMGGTSFQIPRWQQVGSNTYLQNQSGYQLYYPLATPTLIVDQSDANLTNPIAGSPTTNVTPIYALPGLPSPLPAAFGVQLSIDMRNPTSETSYANGFRGEHNGFEIARLQYIAATYWPIIRVTGSTFSLSFTKVAARTGCVAIVNVHGYYI